MTVKIFSVAEMVAAEKAADAAGHSYAAMMETAGRCVADAILQRRDVADCQVLVLVGPGNNGGDGLVAGRFLAEAGAVVAFYLVKPRDVAADENLARVEEMGLEVLLADYDQRHRVLRHRLRITDIVLDALLGTGVSRPIEGQLAGLMEQVGAAIAESRRAGAPEPATLLSVAALPPPPEDASPGQERRRPLVVAVDCPSGLNCDTGALDPLAVAALVVAAVIGATGWGLLLTAVAKSPSQVSSLGSAIMLTFGILGGSFISLNNLPSWVQVLSRFTPNAWGLEGFTALALGGGLPQVALPVAALLGMGAALFGAAVLLFNRQGLVQR